MKNDARIDSGNKQKRIEKKPLIIEPFYVQYGDSLSELFETIGVSDVSKASLAEVVDMTQPWARGDHHAPEKSLELSESQQATAMKIFEAMRMLDEIEPEGGEYDQVLLLGGEQHSNRLRIGYFNEQLTTGDISIADGGSLVSLGGVRKLKGREIFDLGADLAALAGSTQLDPWLGQLLKSEMNDALDEDAAMRVALSASVGSAAMRLSQAHIELGRADIFSHKVFHGDGDKKVIMINAPAVERPLGPPRHTTESTLQEWLRLAPPIQDARVLLVSNNPYVHRTARNLANVLATERPDVRFDYCGASAERNHTLIQRTLGEVARNLYEDLQQSTAS